MPHPLEEGDTRSRLDKIEMTLEHQGMFLQKIDKFLDRAEPWMDEWVGRGNGDHGIRGQVLDALDERKAARITISALKWATGIGASIGAMWAVVHEIFKKG